LRCGDEPPAMPVVLLGASFCPAIAKHWVDVNITPSVTSRSHIRSKGWQLSLINTTHAKQIFAEDHSIIIRVTSRTCWRAKLWEVEAERIRNQPRDDWKLSRSGVNFGRVSNFEQARLLETRDFGN
jgi:hypothetical protein